MSATWQNVRASLRHTWRYSQGSVSLLILWFCVTVHIMVLLLDRTGIMPREEVFAYLAFSYDGVIRHFLIYQFITAALLHGGITHLLFNMLTLWMLGPDVERTLGRSRYILFSMFCAACGFAGFLLLNWGGHNIVIGYSGVIFGILVAQAIYFPNNIVVLFAFFPLKMKHAVLLLGAIELYLTISPEQGRVANSAHLFGAVGAFTYLKLSRINWRWRRVSIPIAPSPRLISQGPVARDWGQAGALIAAALQEIADGQYISARGSLKLAQIPWSLLSIVHDIRRLIALSERFETNDDDSIRLNLERLIERVWKKVQQKNLYAALPPLANIGLRHGERIIPLMLDTLCNPMFSGIPLAIRQSLDEVLAQTGSYGLEMVLARLTDAALPPDCAERLRTLLPAMNLQKHASALMKFYAQARPEDQARWVNCLAGLKDNAAGAMCDLLAGLLNRMPPDLRLAHAIQAKVGVPVLEQIASRWAAGGHRGAQTVLIRLYDYPASSYL